MTKMYLYGTTFGLLFVAVCVPHRACLSGPTTLSSSISITSPSTTDFISRVTPSTATETGPTTSPNSNSITSSSTTDYISTVKSTSATETVDSSHPSNSTVLPTMTTPGPTTLSNSISITSSSTTDHIYTVKSTTATETGPTTSPNSNSITSSSTTDYISTLKSTSATETVKTSKACYGTQGFLLPCTMHTLKCSGMISIQDAYYTNSTACPAVGLSSCNINVSSIPDTGRYRDFKRTQLDTLYRDCSNKTRCTFNGGRAPKLVNFSVVKYMCISGSTTLSKSSSTTDDKTMKFTKTAYPSTTDYILTMKSPTVQETGSGTTFTIISPNNNQRNQGASNTGTVIAVVIPCLLIIVAIFLIAVFIIRRKKAKTANKDDKTNINAKGQEEYSLARDVHQNEYFEIEKSPAKIAKTDYDNAGFVNTAGNASSKDHDVYSLARVAQSNEYFEIEPTTSKKSLMAYDYAELSNIHASTSQNEENLGPTNIQVQEDDYDHVGGKPVIQNRHYDTTASVAKALPKSNSTDKNGDVCSYDHLNDKSTTDNVNNDYDVVGRPLDYDTTASVQKRFDLAPECREDDYGYSHLGNQVQKKTLQNDYDTSASAVTAVARLNSRTDDPDYDHVTKDPGVDSVPSSGDIPEDNEDGSNVYTLARKGDNPYQLSK